ncbi:MAG: hypothetical protein GDA56_21760 [Hormoscilla sp. GM7CHS1pb]|nr:hypothetical protein [Hormoscilla sp. GM7CHS1pb]
MENARKTGRSIDNPILCTKISPKYLERVRVLYNLGLSTGSFVVGIIFVIKGFYQVGFFILGAGLYTIAPEYIKMFLTKDKIKKDEER